MGINCRYDGKNCLSKNLLNFLKDRIFIPLCPEQLGGLPTPRPRAYFASGDGHSALLNKSKIFSLGKKEVTENFIKGANEGLKVARYYPFTLAVLKEGSPSCGVNYTYRKRDKINGCGVFTALLKKEMSGLKIVSELEIKRYDKIV